MNFVCKISRENIVFPAHLLWFCQGNLYSIAELSLYSVEYKKIGTVRKYVFKCVKEQYQFLSYKLGNHYLFGGFFKLVPWH